jgi:ubiquinone/menaquinone biosynthesis C-methylase UbiE
VRLGRTAHRLEGAGARRLIAIVVYEPRVLVEDFVEEDLVPGRAASAEPGARSRREVARPTGAQGHLEESSGPDRQPGGRVILKTMLKRAAAAAARLVGRPLPAASRHHYKHVWTALSATEDAAKLWVQGSTDEAELDRTARNDAERFQRVLHITLDDDVLEIGCGVGRVGKALAPLCRTWIGCDVSPRMLRYAARRLEGLPNVRFVEISGYDLQPIPAESVDVVYCTVVFMHLTEWDRYNYIEEARRVLRPGGRLYVDNISLTTDYGWNFFQASRRYEPARRPPQIGSTSTPQEFEVYLRRAGFASWSVDIVDEAWVVGLGVK